MSALDTSPPRPRAATYLNDPRVRGLAYQALLVVLIALLVYVAAVNAAENLRRANIASGFGFLGNTAGFGINQHLIEYSEASTYGRAFVVGLLNTLLVAALGIVFATILGFLAGIARLSSNWIVARVATAYVELVRNVPLLLQLFIWYNAVLKPLPSPRQSIAVPGGIYLNNRGLMLPRPIFEDGFWLVLVALGLAIAGSAYYAYRARQRQAATGEQAPVFLTTVILLLGLPAAALLLAGFPVSFDVPELTGFNFTGGMQVFPEFAALLIGLVVYTGAFIAEIVRAGILAVSRGQTEAAYALGLRPSLTLRLIVVPQAMRVIIPPLTSQYLNLTKNSSLAVAIGYPDLVQVFTGTVLNQTGQAIEVVAITMAVYLTISLATSGFMNWYNRRVALVER